MPQVFEVLRCFKCFVFQVHQTKKSNKFVCKMCGEKQSIKRIYGLGTGQECRMHVQKLNGIRKELDESKSSENHSTSDEEGSSTPTVIIDPSKIKNSKWSEYIKSNENIDKTNLTDDRMFLNDTEVVLEVIKNKRQRRSIVYHKNRTSNTKSVDEETDTECEKTRVNSSCNLDINVISKQNHFSVPDRQEKQAKANHKYSKKINLNETVELKSKDCKPTLKNTSDLLNQKKIKPTFVPPVINTNSKWFQFTETDISIAQNKIIPEIDSLSNNIESQFQNEINIRENNDHCHYLDHESTEADDSNIKNETYNECILNNIDENSQWIKFTEEHSNESSENHQKSAIEPIQKLQNNPHSLFSLCDDSEIDNLLDI